MCFTDVCVGGWGLRGTGSLTVGAIVVLVVVAVILCCRSFFLALRLFVAHFCQSFAFGRRRKRSIGARGGRRTTTTTTAAAAAAVTATLGRVAVDFVLIGQTVCQGMNGGNQFGNLLRRRCTSLTRRRRRSRGNAGR